MASLITPQFERYVAEQTIARGTVQFDEFIFANIPGLNENNLAQYLTMPTSAQIVHRQAVSQSGVINENAVVYSVTIGTEVGDFDFNFIGLINRSKNLLAVAVQTDTVKKIRNKNAVQGNSITRNMLLEFSGAKALTGINVNANTWQIDFTVRLHGLDEKIRLTNRDLYGRAVFFDDSFLVKRKTGNQFTIQPGTAYVEGVRMDLGAEHHLTANSLPCSIYADVVHHCTVTGEYQTEIKYLTQSKADYVDTANRQHYVQILADIDSQGNVTDRRLLSQFLGMNPLTLDDTTENTKGKLGHTHKLPIASLVKKGIVKLFSGYDSDAEDMAATPKAIKGLKALIDAITRNLGNYIPNSKKSSAVDSNSADTVATSAAVKTAYDLANSKQSHATTLAGYGIGNFKIEPFVGNLNTLKTDGVYAITQASRSQNLPVSTSCHIQVIAGGDGAWCRQLAYVAYSTDVYERHQTSYQADSWSAWVKIDSLDKIPNSKKSSEVDSDSEDTVATSAAVKTANDNANGRVSKSGDTMTGSLAITGSQSGGFANGLMLKNKAGGQNTGVFVDFYQTDNIPRASMWMSDAGNNSTQISFHTTPEGADWNRDSRQGVFTITSSGNLWSKAYGFLHDKFASKSDVYAKGRFRSQWYANHYEGANVFDVPMGDNGVMRTIIMGATIDGYAKLNLPESFNGACRVQVMDVGSGRHVVGANIQNGNVVEVFNSGHTGLNIIATGWYGW